MAVEFGDTVRARTALSYGNWSQPSRHRGDQLRLYAAKELRPVLRDRFRLEANLWLRERF
jgi:acyl-homoserine-lactone acylase